MNPTSHRGARRKFRVSRFFPEESRDRLAVFEEHKAPHRQAENQKLDFSV